MLEKIKDYVQKYFINKWYLDRWLEKNIRKNLVKNDWQTNNASIIGFFSSILYKKDRLMVSNMLLVYSELQMTPILWMTRAHKFISIF